MNWQAVDFDWNQVRAFLATMEEGSLSAAARVLGLTQPTLGRQVAALDRDLGVTLFERAGRRLIPTPAAIGIADHVRAMREAAERLSLAASGRSQSVEGIVKITATEMYSAHVLPGFVAAMRAEHPCILIELVATNSLSDLLRREADIAIRNAEPADPDLIARRLKSERGGLYGAPALIARAGPLRGLDDLASVPIVGFGDTARLLEALQERGAPVGSANVVTGSENHLVHWELARQGLGLGLNGWNVGDADPGMRRVLDDVLSFEFPVWLVAPRELRTNRRIRLVYDALGAYLAEFRTSRDSAANSA